MFEFRIEDRPPELTYSVYVDDRGRIVQVDGVASIGSVQQLVRHRLDVLDPPESVDLAIGTAVPIGAPVDTAPVVDGSAPSASDG